MRSQSTDPTRRVRTMARITSTCQRRACDRSDDIWAIGQFHRRRQWLWWWARWTTAHVQTYVFMHLISLYANPSQFCLRRARRVRLHSNCQASTSTKNPAHRVNHLVLFKLYLHLRSRPLLKRKMRTIHSLIETWLRRRRSRRGEWYGGRFDQKRHSRSSQTATLRSAIVGLGDKLIDFCPRIILISTTITIRQRSHSERCTMAWDHYLWHHFALSTRLQSYQS